MEHIRFGNNNLGCIHLRHHWKQQGENNLREGNCWKRVGREIGNGWDSWLGNNREPISELETERKRIWARVGRGGGDCDQNGLVVGTPEDEMGNLNSSLAGSWMNEESPLHLLPPHR